MDTEGKREKKIKTGKFLSAVQILIIAVMVVLTAGYLFLLQQNVTEDTQQTKYQYHIALIADNKDTSFWKQVYEGAVEAGKKYGVYVEQVGEELSGATSISDAVNIAVYEGVDGILFRPSDTKASMSMIERAQKAQIPVITVQKDVTDSRRQGFVGINDYFLGMEYGKRILKIADEDTRLVTVLFPGTSFNGVSQEWFRMGLKNTVRDGKIRFDFRVVQDANGLNNAEDILHDMMTGKTDQPDVIICLDEVITLSASQMADSSAQGKKPKVIGSYFSDEILAAIEEGKVDSTITIDPKELGSMSVDALMTYKNYHMVSYYTEVKAKLIDREEAGKYREEIHENEESF